MDQREFEQFLDQLMYTIKDKFKYWRTYSATVKMVTDIFQMKGLVGVECLELLAKDPLSYIWARPVGSFRGYAPPKEGDQVILFFKDTNPESPRIIADIPEGMAAMMPIQMKYTLVETAQDGSYINVEEFKGFTIESKSVLGAIAPIEKMVLGEKLKSLLDSIFDDYITDIYDKIDKVAGEMLVHMHTGNMGVNTPLAPGGTQVIMGQVRGEIGAKKGEIKAKKALYGQDGQLLSPANKNN